MSDGTNIEWTDATWNPITGCSIVSPGCTNCYAMKLAGTRLRNIPSRAGLTKETKAGPVWTGEVRFNEGWLTQPLKWKRPRKIFVCAHGDLFAEGVPDEWIDKVFAVMALCPQHTFQVLTKRAARMRSYLNDPLQHNRMELAAEAIQPSAGKPFSPKHILPRVLPNIWLGVSAERQDEWDERNEHLRGTPAAVTFASCEPLLGSIKFRPCRHCNHPGNVNEWPCPHCKGRRFEIPDWVIAGGESGPDARPMHPDWVRSLRDQCAAAGVPYFFKQWGNWMVDTPPGSAMRGGTVAWPDGSVGGGHADDHGGMGTFLFNRGKAKAGRLLDGVEHNGMPGSVPQHHGAAA